MLEHGGNLHHAMATFGGQQKDWIDLSTGINRVAYPLPVFLQDDWCALPTATHREPAVKAARSAYGCDAMILPVAGAQAAIQMVPFMHKPGAARVLGPTYNEHAGCLKAQGWQVEEVSDTHSLRGADLAVVVNPNNPDGRLLTPQSLIDLAAKVGLLVVDESFMDPTEQDSIAPRLNDLSNCLVLRSFGKFYGLAGIRLGFVLGPDDLVSQMTQLAGPWPVSGPALRAGAAALEDQAWKKRTIERLREDTKRMDGLALASGWALQGGTHLFRLYQTANAQTVQESLASHHIWSRIFPFSQTLVRLGLPGSETEWSKLKRAFSAGQ